MKLYETIKVYVDAEPMSRGDYNRFRGWELPADEDGSDKGYLVNRNAGSEPDWCWVPEAVFERSYRAV